jgi:hypothetical protein
MLSQSHVLNIDCVLNAICVYQVERDWEKTLRKVMPLRRQVSGGKKMRKLGHQGDVDMDMDGIDDPDDPGPGNDDDEPPTTTTTRTVETEEREETI